MYHIEVLPSSKDSAAPGWAYVADNGYDPSKAAIVPSGARKRARLAHPSSSAASNDTKTSQISARQASKVAKHLADLDRENHKDVQIVVPNKPRDVGARGLSGGKGREGKVMTPGVKKILLSQKTWANYLADEEAALALKGEGRNGTLPLAPPTLQRLETGASAKGKGRERDGRRRRSTLKEAETVDEEEVEVGEAMDVDVDVEAHGRTADALAMPPPPTPTPATLAAPSQQATQVSKASNPLPTADDDDPLLRSRIPSLPTQTEIQALLAAPPLSYNASRAAPSTSTAPPRKFCEMCGYWGRAMCVKCGARVCGLDCRNQHEETRCLKFYA